MHGRMNIKQHCFFEGSQASAFCHSGNSNMQMRMSMDLWWNDTEGASPKYWAKNLFQWHYFYYGKVFSIYLKYIHISNSCR